MKDPGRILIIGAGPTGLGAAYRLQELGLLNFTVLESGRHPGGLARSYVDPMGFTWDVGGHVHFSHYRYYDQVLNQAIGDQWLCHQREAWIWVRQRFVPYPFQNNIHRLDSPDRDKALSDLVEARKNISTRKPRHFRDQIEFSFGEGAAEIFFYPYNLKVWGYPLDSLAAGWIVDRLAMPDPERIRENIQNDGDDVSWGPNRFFRYPARGGTGAIWHGVASLIQGNRIQYGNRVTSVDLGNHRLSLQDGRQLPYDTLITSAPLDSFCRMCASLPKDSIAPAMQLVHSSCHIVGLGLKGEMPALLKNKCWIYFPEEHSPYYRVTVLSRYSPHNVPEGQGCWSLMTEICETPLRPVRTGNLLQQVVKAMEADGLLSGDNRIVSYWHHREEHAYPTPFLGCDDVLGRILPELEKHDVYSRGRFGMWRYEISNQDHSFMQGVEVVNRLTGRGEEYTVTQSELVNSGAFLK